MLRSFVSFAALSLFAVACTQAADDGASASADINVAGGLPLASTPKCTEEPSVEGIAIFQDAQRSNVFYALPDAWSIDPIVAPTPVLEDTNKQPWVDAAQKLSPMLNWNETTLHIEASTHLSLDALKGKLAAAHPELTNVEVRTLPLSKRGDAQLTVLNHIDSDPAKVEIAQTNVTSLDVKVNHATMGGKDGFLVFLLKKAAPLQLQVPVSFACSGDMTSRNLNLSANGASFSFPGKGITVTNEETAFVQARSVVNSAESMLSISDLPNLPAQYQYTPASKTALHEGLDAALLPVLSAPASALHTTELTKKAAADAVIVVDAFKAANPNADVSSLLDRVKSVDAYVFYSGTEPFRK